MAHLSSISASMFTDLSVHIPATALTAAQLANLNNGADFFAKFSSDLAAGVAKGAGTFRRINNIREMPAIGGAASITKVPLYGSKTTRQIGGQSDLPDLNFKLNYVANDWRADSDLGGLLKDGTQAVFRYTLMNLEPAAYNTTGLGAVENTQYFFIGRLESNQITPSLTDSTQSELKISCQSEFFGPFTWTASNLPPVRLAGYTAHLPMTRPVTALVVPATGSYGGLLYAIEDPEGDIVSVVPNGAYSSASPDKVTQDTTSGEITLENVTSGIKLLPGRRAIYYNVADGSGGVLNTAIFKSIAYASTVDVFNIANTTTTAPFTVTAGTVSNPLSISVAAGATPAVRLIKLSTAALTAGVYHCMLAINATSAQGQVALVVGPTTPPVDVDVAMATAVNLGTTTATRKAVFIEVGVDQISNYCFSFSGSMTTRAGDFIYLMVDNDFAGTVQCSAAPESESNV